MAATHQDEVIFVDNFDLLKAIMCEDVMAEQMRLLEKEILRLSIEKQPTCMVTGQPLIESDTVVFVAHAGNRGAVVIMTGAAWDGQAAAAKLAADVMGVKIDLIDGRTL